MDVWQLLEESLTPISAQFREATKDVAPHTLQSLKNWGYMRWLMMMDEPTNGKLITEKAQGRAYISPKAMDNAFRGFVAEGYAAQDGDLFSMTDKGREAYQDYFNEREQAFEAVTILPDADFEVYINFLKKGYEAAKTADTPAHIPSMDYGYDFYSSVQGGQLGAMFGWINLFELYRDDVHAAQWQAAGFTGIQIEVLTKIWQDNAHSASDLAAQLVGRGYDESDYQAALDTLAARGYVQANNGRYKLTAQGTTTREQIEADTDVIYNEWVAETYTDEDIADFARVVAILTTA